jgi:hypothetical protein
MDPRRTLIAALAAPLMLLAACGGNDTSVVDPPISPATPSSSPTTPPKRETPEHFIRRWARAEKRMENTGKTRAYMAISRSCTACRQLADDISGFYSAGGFARWGGWTILSLDRSGAQDGSLVYAVKVDSAPTTFKRSANGHVQHLPGGPATHQLTVKVVHGSWQVLTKAQLAT